MNIEKLAAEIKKKKSELTKIVSDISKIMFIYNMNLKDDHKYSVEFNIGASGNMIEIRVYEEDELIYDKSQYGISSFFNHWSYYSFQDYDNNRILQLKNDLLEMKRVVIKYTKLDLIH